MAVGPVEGLWALNLADAARWRALASYPMRAYAAMRLPKRRM